MFNVLPKVSCLGHAARSPAPIDRGRVQRLSSLVVAQNGCHTGPKASQTPEIVVKPPIT